MIPVIDIKADYKKVELRLKAIGAEAAPAVSRAINRTTLTVRKEAIKQLSPEYPGIKAGVLRSRMRIDKSTRATLTGAVVFRPARIPLYGNFGMRGVKGGFGVKFRNLPWRVETPEGEEVPRAKVEKAFRNRLKNGGRLAVLVRTGASRYPITVLLAPGLSRTVVERQIAKALVDFGRARFAVALQQETNYLLQKAAA